MTALQNDRMRITGRTKTICPLIFDLGGIIITVITNYEMFPSFKLVVVDWYFEFMTIMKVIKVE